jgi:hypothetical protein
MGTTYTSIINGVPVTANSKEALTWQVQQMADASGDDFNAWGTSAAANYAQVTRQQWEEYKKFGVPVEDKLISMIDNQGQVNQNLADATSYGMNRAIVNKNESARKLQGYGIEPTADEAKVNNRISQMNTTASMGDALNAVRRNAKDLDRQILIGGAPNDGLDAV